MILASGKATQSRNASATLAFHKFRTQQEDDVEERKKPIKIEIEQVKGSYLAKLHIPINSCLKDAKDGIVLGPARKSTPEAIKDAQELGRSFVHEGLAGVNRMAERLESRHWTPKDIEHVDETDLEVFAFPHEKRIQALGMAKQERALPPGEGWVRHDEVMLVNPQSQVYFAQVGDKAGRYFRRVGVGTSWQECDPPHKPVTYPLSLRAASASWVRKGAKLDRAVILNDITKIARLALKFPLSFVDVPACAFALFQGHRSAESAQWCAENFHKKLLPLLAEKIHTYEVAEMEVVLRKTLEALDAELLKSAHSFSGCSAIVALVLGERLAVAGIGQVRAVLMPDKGPVKHVLDGTGALSGASQPELERIQKEGGMIRDGLLFGRGAPLPEADEAARILAARDAFEVLQLDPSATGFDEKQVRSAYRKLALRVHPDKQTEGADSGSFKAAFARLDPAKEALEAMVGADLDAAKEIHRVLCSDVHTRAGAAALLGVDKTAMLDTEQVAEEAAKASKALVRKFAKMQYVCPDYHRAVDTCTVAVETMRCGCTPEALPRQEALLREGVTTSCLMGARDLRRPHAVAVMSPQTASQTVAGERTCRLALLTGGTAALADEHLTKAAAQLGRQPKAAALRWCLETDASERCASALCLVLEAARGADEPPAKKPRATGTAGPEGTVRIRHILIRHQQLKQPDLMARREGSARNAQEAEMAALQALEKLIREPNQFLRLCRELSDCQSGAQPGMLSGDLGWLGKGQQEQGFEDAAFSLKPNEFGDVVTTSRGVHIIQRLA